MPSIKQNLGVQSYCFRGFKDNAKVAGLVREIGVSRIELCRVHIDFNNRAQHKPVADTYRQAGVQIASVGVERTDVEESRLRDVMEFCRVAGAKVVSCSFKPGMTDAQHQTALRLAREYDVRLAIHNHGGRHWLGSIECLNWVFEQAKARGDDRLGLCIDTAWALDAGEDPVAMAEKFSDRLFGIHIKDFVFDRAGKPEDVVVGTGNLNLPKLIQVAEKAGFTGSCVLEYEGDVENPTPALARCVEAVRNAG